MTTMPLWQHFVFAALATAGFSIFFNTPKKLLKYVAAVGGLSWMVYLFGVKYIENPALYSFLSACVVSICSEVLARKLKQPAIIIIIPGILPLIPGIGLYKMVYNIMIKDYSTAATVGSIAFVNAIGITLAIVFITSMAKVFNLYKLKKAFTENDALKYVNWVNLGKNRTNTRYVLNRKELNDNLNSLNIDVEKKYVNEDDINRMERSITEDYVEDYDSEKNFR
ncbi:threonine/serine exporter family protein [Peptostreptococcus equinus]|uniref:Threonine/serine exporter family protein n=1 Tax=Peptostreptococcus equinus TaxID=3003601 RepID=A0ABY7JU26_9FIRM|nr:threonine/serine exporter family protein [Peptostreptococcus sp. CBA3647]WAW15573.1 threonine/serine exporter family protein [Peptostreptococcus sp. CBA3647]